MIFLTNNSKFVSRTVRGVAEDTYTQMYGHQVIESLVLHISGQKNRIKGNLITGKGIKEGLVDCFICTQTLQFMGGYERGGKENSTNTKTGGN